MTIVVKKPVAIVSSGMTQDIVSSNANTEVLTPELSCECTMRKIE
jgi:hypothetical protein